MGTHEHLNPAIVKFIIVLQIYTQEYIFQNLSKKTLEDRISIIRSFLFISEIYDNISNHLFD